MLKVKMKDKGDSYTMTERRTLAWHETLELHELVAFQANGLVKLKRTERDVSDARLKQLYRFSIHSLEQNLRELLPFFPEAPAFREDETEERADSSFTAAACSFWPKHLSAITPEPLQRRPHLN